VANPNISFVRLGHFSLDDNMRTNYQARELKTVYLEQYCQYLKIVMNKCHLNNFNIFNQVGIVSINCIGSYMGEYEVGMITNKIIHQPNPALP
jgi:centrosomal protein CEP104